MSTDNTPRTDDDAVFEGMVRASGVPVTEAEKKNLRTAYSALMGMAAKVRKPGRSWAIRMMPNFTPKPPTRRAADASRRRPPNQSGRFVPCRADRGLPRSNRPF